MVGILAAGVARRCTKTVFAAFASFGAPANTSPSAAGRRCTGRGIITTAAAQDAGAISYTQGQHEGDCEPAVRARRLYFYYVDHNGRLFLDDTKVKNFATCYKDRKFLHFFYTRLRRSRAKDPGYGQYGEAFEWVSPCGRETNFVRCDATPVVYDQLAQHAEPIPSPGGGGGGAGSAKGMGWRLSYAGDNFNTAFDPRLLELSASSGRLFYPNSVVGSALIATQLTFELGKSITFTDTETTLVWEGEAISIKEVG